MKNIIARIRKSTSGFGQIYKRLITSYFLIGFCTILIVLIFALYLINSSVKSDMMQKNNEAISRLTNLIDRYALGSISDLSNIISSDLVNDENAQQYITGEAKGKYVDALSIQKYLRRICTINPFVESVDIYFDKCDMLITQKTIRDASTSDLSYGNRYRYCKQLSEDNLFSQWISTPSYLMAKVGDTTLSHAIPAIEFCRKFSPKTDSASTIFITILTDSISSVLQSGTGGFSDRSYILDSDKQIIVQSDGMSPSDPLSPAWIDHIFEENRPKGSFEIPIDGVDHIVSYNKSNQTDWYYVSIVAADKVLHPYRMIMRALWILLGTLVIIAIVYPVICSRHIYKPFGDLKEACEIIYFDRNHEKTKKSSNEIDLIKNTINVLHSNVKMQKDLLDANQAMLVEEYLHRIYKEECAPDDFLTELERRGFEVCFDTVCAVIVTIPGGKPDARTADALYARFNTDESKAVTFCDENRVILFLNYDCAAYTVNDIIRQIRTLLNCDIMAAYSVIQKDHEMIEDSILRAVRTAKYHWLYPSKKVLDWTDIEDNELNNAVTDDKKLALWEKSLSAGDYTLSALWLDNEISLMQTDLYSYKSSIISCQKIENILRKDIENQKYTEIREELLSALISPLKAENILAYQTILRTIIDKSADLQEQYRSGFSVLAVEKAKEYIQKNITNSQLSLSSTASELGISTSYLSKLFKKETGCNFSEYISNCRLQYSCELLVTTDVKIEEIAESFNYSTPQYFSNRFKKKFGCTPKEYRLKARYFSTDEEGK